MVAKKQSKEKKVPNTDKRGGRRGKKDVIKSESVFSMGPAGKSTQGREGKFHFLKYRKMCVTNCVGVRDAFGNDLSSIRKKSVNTTSDKSTSSSSTVRIHREEEEENDLGQIPNQTFVEDLFQDSRLPPVQLPLEHNVCRKLASKQVEKGPPDRKSQVDVTRESLDTAAKLFEHVNVDISSRLVDFIYSTYRIQVTIIFSYNCLIACLSPLTILPQVTSLIVAR